jgi:hypothetical protein
VAAYWGTELAARANPDGYTLVLVTTAHALKPGLLAKLPFDSLRGGTNV